MGGAICRLLRIYENYVFFAETILWQNRVIYGICRLLVCQPNEQIYFSFDFAKKNHIQSISLIPLMYQANFFMRYILKYPLTIIKNSQYYFHNFFSTETEAIVKKR